jgi:ferric-dicitrate binding protein FerR (iron transport regulator)
MRCDEAVNLISSNLDGEIARDDRSGLDEHLSTCPACREIAGELTLQNAQLTRAFAARRRAAGDLAERVIAQLPTSSVVTRRRSFWSTWSPLLAAAAGFAVALMIFRPWNANRAGGVNPVNQVINVPSTGTTPKDMVARLALATGRVFVCPSGSDQWRPLETGGQVEPGAAVRTDPKARCEFKMADGSEVRLNSDTQATLHAPRKVEVASGQIFSTVITAKTPEDRFVVHAAPAKAELVAMGTAFDVTCSPKESKATLTVVEGSVKVAAKSGSASGEEVLKAGETIDLAGGGAFGDKKQVQNLMQATQWVDEILVMKGRDNQELARRMNHLFAMLGQDKMNYMAEEEIRRLGDHCVVPLTRYIESDLSKGRDRNRHNAARLVADVATTSSIPELINLLADRDGEVRYHAARALQRLTGDAAQATASARPQEWRDQSLMQCTPMIDQWHAWWDKNKSRYPGADPDAVKPVDVAKGATEIKGKG